MIVDLRELRPDLRLTVTSATPEKTAADYCVEAFRWSDASAMLEAVRSADLVVIGGGGIFHDYWGFNPNAVLTDNQAGVGFFSSPGAMAAIYNKPVMLYACSLRPLI